MSALERFERLTPDQRRKVVARVKAGLVDEPADYPDMLALVEEDNRNLSQLPGGMSRLERDSHELRVKAARGSRPGYVDLVGDQARRSAARDAARMAARRQESLGGYRPPYPWMEN